MWAVMNEPGVVDARDLRLLRYPPLLADVDLRTGEAFDAVLAAGGEDIEVGPAEVAVLVEDPRRIEVA
jgi:hypothetical protein